MAILDSELKAYKASVVTNDGTNGGRMSANQTNSVSGDFFPLITNQERTTGSTVYRKLFPKAHHDGLTDFQDVRFYLTDHSPGDTRFYCFAATQRNTQANITGSERKYGAGRLSTATVTAGVTTTFTVAAEPGNGAADIFQVGDTIIMADATNKAELTITARTWTSDSVSITVSTAPVYTFLAATPTTVSSCITAASVIPQVDNYVKTGTFTFNDTTYPITGHGMGTIEQTWTLTFSSATAFSVVGDTVGSIGAGTIGSNFSPTNPTWSRAYFNIPSAGWGGSPVNGDTMLFQTHPGCLPVYLARILPAGAASSLDNIRYAFTGQSA